MLCSYAVNLPGPTHRDRHIPCQDAYAVRALGERLVVAAVADGLGSETHSQLGARIASGVAVRHCARGLRGCATPESVLTLMRAAFAAAWARVKQRAAELGEDPGQFDCTLTLALYDGQRLYWGQAGDSGIVAARDDGRYEPITAMQRDGEGRVYPLCFEDRWEFGAASGVASLLLATDGVLERLVPPVLAVHGTQPVDTRTARLFLHPEPGDAERLDELEAEASAWLDAYPRHLLDDDKTVVVLFDSEHAPAEQPASYYAGPDWSAIAEAAEERLYAGTVAPETDADGVLRDHKADALLVSRAVPAPQLTQPAPAPASANAQQVVAVNAALDAMADSAELLVRASVAGAREAWRTLEEGLAQQAQPPQDRSKRG